jgi:hypothetical protein
VRLIAYGLTNRIRRERNKIIRDHVKSAHLGRLYHCEQGACPSLRNRVPLPATPLELPAELIEVDLY